MASSAHVGESIAEAVEVSEDLPSYSTKLRFNEGRCSAPNTEVFLKGTWRRAHVRAVADLDQPVLDAAITSLSTRDLLATVIIEGRLARRPFRTAEGIEWPIFEIVRLDDRSTNAMFDGEGLRLVEVDAVAARPPLTPCVELSRAHHLVEKGGVDE